ncbi:MAG: phosphotransferase, partial [Planctomycetaceae bacterium]|nr:phosphotransferase [Planctomycetaceae bacterium]
MRTSIPDQLRKPTSPDNANAFLIRRETQLPGLAAILEPGSLESEVCRLTGTSQLSEIRLSYLRYKPFKRCVAVLNAVSERGPEQIVATAMRDDSWQHWTQKKVIADHEAFCLSLDPIRLRLERFPCDRQLRPLSRLFAIGRRQRMLEQILPSRSGLNSILKNPEQVEIVQRAYKPARRFVASVGSFGQPRVALKLYSKKGFQAVGRRLKMLKQLPDFEVPEVFQCDRHCATATQWVSGEALADISLTAELEALLPLFMRTGETLGDLHNVPMSSRLGFADLNLSLTAVSLRSIAQDLELLYPSISSRVRALVEAVICQLPFRGLPTLIHGDFYARQVIVNGSDLRFIDFDELGVGPSWLDVGNFTAKIHWSSLRGQLPHCPRRLISAFLAGYQSRRHWDEDAFRVSVVIGLLRCMPHAFRMALQDWPSRLEEAVTLAEDVLNCRAVQAHSNQSVGSGTVSDNVPVHYVSGPTEAGYRVEPPVAETETGAGALLPRATSQLRTWPVGSMEEVVCRMQNPLIATALVRAALRHPSTELA